MSGEYFSDLDPLFSPSLFDKAPRCSCCLFEPCLFKDEQPDAGVMSTSFTSPADLPKDSTFAEIETNPMNLFEFTNPENILDRAMRELDDTDMISQIQIENRNLFDERDLTGNELRIKKPKVSKHIDIHPNPLSAPEEGERQRKGYFQQEKYVCDVCETTFTMKHNFVHHFYQHHHPRIASKMRVPKDVVSRFYCGKCDKVFTDIEKARKHEEKLHRERPRKTVNRCDQCNKTYASNNLLLEHIAVVHEKQRPFACDICSQTFGRLGGLRRHQETVHGNKTLMCSYEGCDHPGFKCSKALAAHIRSQHTNERPFVCLYCEKTFVRKNDLRGHEMTHLDGCHFKCDNCGKDFKRQAYLRKHKFLCNG